MYFYMFGMDAAEPEHCAAQLAKLGFSAVVCPADQRCIGAVRNAGMDAFVCAQAFPLTSGISKCQDVDGRERVWFSSGCPNDPDDIRRREDRWYALAQMEGLSGVFIDGARFASPASPEGFESLFTCFCPNCMAQMEAEGFHAEEMRNGVREWRDGLRPLPPAEWLAFRQIVVDREMNRFVRCVKAANASLLTGAFVFPASLGALVGQTASACASMDICAPMLYRCYGELEGPATLNHEYAALREHFGAGRTLALTGVSAPDDVLSLGFPPSQIRRETAHAGVAGTTRLAPILQLDDPLLVQSIAAAIDGGATDVGFFMYDSALLHRLPDLNRF